MWTWFVFALVLFAALAFLISYGLERQRRELAGLRREVEAWVAADLRLKRARLGLDLAADFHPQSWLLRLLRRSHPHNAPTGEATLEPVHDGGAPGVWLKFSDAWFFVTPKGKRHIQQFLRQNRGRLEGPVVTGNLDLLPKARAVRVGLADDVLLDLAWERVCKSLGLPEETPNELWVYLVRPEGK